MQLKDFGKFVGVIDEVKKMGTIYALGSDSTKILEKSFKDLTSAQILAKTSTMGLTEAQQLELVQQFATDSANYSNVTSTNALSASQKGATTSTLGLSNAFKGLWASIKGWVVAHPYLTTLAGIGATIGILVKAYDTFNTSLEEHKEKLEEATSKLEETRSEIESLNSELETTKERIEELEGLETPSLVEEQELEQLKQQNKELERELRIKQELEKLNQTEVNKKAYMYFNNPLTDFFTFSNDETPLEEAKRNIEEIQTLQEKKF